jgi:hypothetical protein
MLDGLLDHLVGAGEPRLYFGDFVSGIVIHDDMDIEPFGDLSINLFEEIFRGAAAGWPSSDIGSLAKAYQIALAFA